MRRRVVAAALGCGVSALAACNPVESSRAFDESRGSKRFVLVTRFPMDLRPRAFEQDGAGADWVELAIPDASGVSVEVSGRQLLVPAAEENVVLEYYDRELSPGGGRDFPKVISSFGLVHKNGTGLCEVPLCYTPRLCYPNSANVVTTASTPAMAIGGSLLMDCSK